MVWHMVLTHYMLEHMDLRVSLAYSYAQAYNKINVYVVAYDAGR